MKPIKILVVEDEGILQLDLMARLADLGYTVAAVASSGEAAIREAARTEPDLVLMDIRIKGSMDGVETARALRSQYDVPIIFVSALNDPVTSARIEAFGQVGFLTKPFRDADLERVITEALEKLGNTWGKER